MANRPRGVSGGSGDPGAAVLKVWTYNMRVAQAARTVDHRHLQRVTYAQKRGAAVEAKNTCTKIIKLAEARIGRELKAGRERGEIATQRERTGKAVLEKHQDGKPTLADIGISYDQSVDYQILGEAPETVIVETVDHAADERLVQVDAALGPQAKARNVLIPIMTNVGLASKTGS